MILDKGNYFDWNLDPGNQGENYQIRWHCKIHVWLAQKCDARCQSVRDNSSFVS